MALVLAYQAGMNGRLSDNFECSTDSSKLEQKTTEEEGESRRSIRKLAALEGMVVQ
jgi:hypothetical protein